MFAFDFFSKSEWNGRIQGIKKAVDSLGDLFANSLTTECARSSM